MGERDREELGDCEAHVVEVRLAVVQAVELMLGEDVCEGEKVGDEVCVTLGLGERVAQGLGERLGEAVLLLL